MKILCRCFLNFWLLWPFLQCWQKTDFIMPETKDILIFITPFVILLQPIMTYIHTCIYIHLHIHLHLNSNHSKETGRIAWEQTKPNIKALEHKLELKEETKHVKGSLCKALKTLVISRNTLVLDIYASRIGSLSGNGSRGFAVYAPLASSARRDRGRQLKAGALFTAAWGRKQADVNEGWRFHEAQLVDGRFNVTGLNWAMIRTVCKIHFLAGLCPPAPSSKRSSPSPSSYAFECN